MARATDDRDEREAVDDTKSASMHVVNPGVGVCVPVRVEP
jgi:hypothetical protein